MAPSQPSTTTVEALDDAERHSDTPALTLSSAPDADTATDEDDGDKGAAIANEQRQVTMPYGRREGEKESMATERELRAFSCSPTVRGCLSGLFSLLPPI